MRAFLAVDGGTLMVGDSPLMVDGSISMIDDGTFVVTRWHLGGRELMTTP
jgi:hypothetical protein